jgi:hypothetical protein
MEHTYTVTRARHILRLCGLRKGPLNMKLAVNIPSKQSPTADKDWFSYFGVGRVTNNFSP